jgi:hypothetical protein
MFASDPLILPLFLTGATCVDYLEEPTVITLERFPCESDTAFVDSRYRSRTPSTRPTGTISTSCPQGGVTTSRAVAETGLPYDSWAPSRTTLAGETGANVPASLLMGLDWSQELEGSITCETVSPENCIASSVDAPARPPLAARLGTMSPRRRIL